MARSTKKGPFVDTHLSVKIEVLNTANDKKVVKTWSRARRPGGARNRRAQSLRPQGPGRTGQAVNRFGR